MITSENGTKIPIDPYKNALGYKMPEEIEADIVATSHDHSDHNYILSVKSSFVHINISQVLKKEKPQIIGILLLLFRLHLGYKCAL